jgi:hypothetical protein
VELVSVDGAVLYGLSIPEPPQGPRVARLDLRATYRARAALTRWALKHQVEVLGREVRPGRAAILEVGGTVPTKIPNLLTEETIAAIRERAAAATKGRSLAIIRFSRWRL